MPPPLENPAAMNPSGTPWAASSASPIQIRLYDLLAHGWGLGQATGSLLEIPDALADQSLAFARTQLTAQARRGRFGPTQIAPREASALERLVAFLGRPIVTDG